MVIRVAIGCEERGTAACKYASKLLKTSCASYTQRASSACFVLVDAENANQPGFSVEPKKSMHFWCNFWDTKRAASVCLSTTCGFLSAVGGGFEPPVRLPVRQFSKLVVSATHPSHQTDSFFLTGLQIYKEFIVLQLFGADFVIFKVEYVTFPEQITLTKPSHKESVKTLCDGSLFRYFSSENGTVTH